MKKYNIVFLSLVLLIIFGLSFYWFAYRPSQTKKFCSQRAEELVNSYTKCDNSPLDYMQTEWKKPEIKSDSEIEDCMNDYFNDQYYKCLKENGI